MIIALDKNRHEGARLSPETKELLQGAIVNLCKAFELAQREVGHHATSIDLIYTRPEGPNRSYHVMVLDLGNRN